MISPDYPVSQGPEIKAVNIYRVHGNRNMMWMLKRVKAQACLLVYDGIIVSSWKEKYKYLIS